MMKHTKHLLVLWAALLLGAGNAWGYTVTFNTATTDGGSTSTNVYDYVDNTSQTYIASITTSKAYYNGKSGVKLGSSSAVGNIVLTLSATGQIKASEISIVSTAYSTDSKKYKCTVTYTDNNTVSQDLTAGEEVTISLDPAKTVSSVKFESVTKSKGRCYIGSFTITPAGSTPTTYNVEPQPTTGGSITVDPTTAAEGAEISISATPDANYKFDSWTISPSVTFTTGSASTAAAKFTMPAQKVTVKANFTPIEGQKYTVNFYVEGTLKQSLTQTAAGAAITLPTSYTGCGDYTFAGWSTTDNHSNAPEVTGSTYTPTANTNLYAVYSKTGSGNAPTAYTAGDVGNYVIATLSEGKYYALPNNPTVNSGKITGVEITTETTAGNVVYVSTSNAVGYTWTIANAANGQTISDGSKYIYHSTGGNSSTNLAYGTSTSYTWAIEKEQNGLTFQAMNGTTTNNRGMLCNGTTFGGYALSNEDASGYNRIVVLPIGGSTTTHTTRPGCDCTHPSTPLTISAGATALNLDEHSSASTTLNTTGGNGGQVNYTVSPSATISGNTITFNKEGTYTVTATQEKNDFCSQQADVIITVKATPIVTLTADAPIKLTADCGQTTTAKVKVTAYNCGTNDVTITSNDEHVTVSPASFTPTDGKVNDEVTLSYTASKGDAAEKYTATISATCGSTAGQNTISVTATKGGCTPSVLTFIDRGNTHTTINTKYAGEQLAASEVPVPTGVCTQPVNYIFDGWATASVANDATTYTKVNFDTYTITGNQTFYAVYKYTDGTDQEVTFNASDISNLTELSSLSWKDNTSNVTLTLSAGQRYTSGTPNTFTVTKGNTNYFEVAGNSDIKKVVVEISENNYTINTSKTDDNVTVSTADANLIQTLTVTTPKNSVKGYALADYQIRMKTITVTCGTTYYTSSPACGPYVQIVGSKDIYVTSGNVGGRKTVQAQDTIRFTSGALQPQSDTGKAPRIKIEAPDITINGTPAGVVEVTFVDSTRTKNDVDGTYSITGGIVVKYKPTNSNATENIKVKLRAEYNTENVVLDSFMVHARSLPEKFVITAKGTDGKWYALPADMSGSSTQPANGQLVVDKTDNPTKATITPCNTIYKFDGQKQGGDLRYVRFVGLDGKYLWAATTGNPGIQNTGSEDAAKADNKPYNWLLTSADNVTYTFANQNTDRTLRLSGTNFGMYTSGVNELRILPIVEDDTCAYNAAPQNITLVSKTSTTVTLAWAAVPGAERYQYNVGTIWNDCTVDDLDYPQATITGLGTGATVTIALRAVHGTAKKICSDTAQITVTTANCDDVPTISGTINGGSSCGTLTLTATGVTASSDARCPITQYGFQYTQDTTTWATYEQTKHDDVPGSEFSDEVTVSRGGKYYVRLYAVNEVGIGSSTPVKEITVSGLANLQIITAGDATTAPMISGKATLRIGAVSDSPSPITWQVFDGSNAEQTTIAAGIANNGVFSTTAFGVYRVVAKQAANADPTYCADSATIYIEVRLPNHYGYVTNCAVLNNNNLEVINVSKDNITFGIDDADVVQIEIVKENTGNTSTGGGGQAEGLFFSKYYEATSNVKLIAVYNGTNQDIDLTNYTIKYGKTSWESNYITLKDFGKTKGTIAAGEEIILYSYNGSGYDNNILKCVNDSNQTYQPWVRVTTDNNTGGGSLVFAGDKVVALFKGDTPIDVIGAIASTGKPTNTGASVKTPSWGDDNGWTCDGGTSIIDDTPMELSTNRCLLIRKNTVTSGQNAITKNIADFVTLCEEWSGFQIINDETGNISTNPNYKGVLSSCEGFSYVGTFDYAEYFQRYEPVTGKIDLVPLNQNADGSWSLSTGSFAGTAWDGKNFHDLACTSVKINGYQKTAGGKDSLTTALNYKVPIIVDRTTTTEDADLFGFAGEGRLICPECDVVIRDNQKLSVVPAGYNNIRDMWVYSGAALNIQNDKTYNMGKLTIESENNEVGYALIKGTLNAQDGISHTKRIDANAWYDFSLPYNCKVSDIVRTNGKTLGLYSVNTGDLAKNDTARWVIKYYDGQKRAISGTPNGAAPTNWAVVPADGILEAGVGYIVALGGTHNANPNYKVRFVLPNRSTQPYVESVADKRTKGVKGYTGPKAEELPCHKGWNYLGNPYVSRFDGDKQNPSWQTYTGLLLNGFYTDLLTGNSYAEYPDIYVAVDMGEGGVTNWVQTKASGAQLSPFRAFMIQAVSDGDVDFNKEARNIPQNDPITPAPSVRSVNTERETVSAVRLNIDHDTYGTGSTDIMLHSLYTDKYDLGYDMVRMFNSRPAAQPFTLNSTADYLLYNAANRDLAETSDIPVGIRTLAAGTYTFSLAPLTGTDRYAAIYLIDRDENDLKIDLLQGNYTTMLARETNTSRFALRFEKGAQLPTDIDNDAIQSPIIYRDQTDIVIDNLPTDATVRVVDAIGRTLYMQQADAQIVRFHAPARGAYIIQVMTQQGNFSIKTIL